MENFEKLYSLIKLCLGAKHLPYLFSQVCHWEEDVRAYGTVSHFHNKAPPHCSCIIVCIYMGIPSHCQNWICTDENHTSISIFVISCYLPPSILCENASYLLFVMLCFLNTNCDSLY